jgi:hypothetical protein
MAWVATAVIGGSVITGLLGAQAAGDAADAQRQSAQMGVDEQRRQFDQTRSDNLPWLTQGKSGLYKLSDLLGIDTPKGEAPTRAMFTRTIPAVQGQATSLPGVTQTYTGGSPARDEVDEAGYQKALAEWQALPSGRTSQFGSLLQPFTGANLASDPGYQFGLDQGTHAVDQSAVARGGLFSGKTMRDLMQFGQDYGGTKFNEAFNRDASSKNQTYSMLSGISGTGASTAGNLGALGANSANNISNLVTGAGNAQAAGIVGQANAWGNAIGTGTNAYLTNQYLGKMNQPRTGNVFGGVTGV